MSNTPTRTRKPRVSDTSGFARPLRPVPAPDAVAAGRTDTEDKLWAALHAHPYSPAVDLSTAAGIGKSTAGKILARWASNGSVTRTAGIAAGGRRAADLWAITPTGTTAPIDAADGVDPVDHPAVAGTPQPAPDTPEATTTAPDVVHRERIAAEPDDRASADTDPKAAAADDNQCTAGSEPVALTDGGPAVGPVAKAERKGNGDGQLRLGPGGLRGIVEDELRDNPGAEFSPVQIAKKHGRSSGAVSNALDKLVEAKIAVQTKDRPRRYALAPAEATTTSA